MTAYGASRPLPSVTTKVRLLNRLPTPRLGRGDYSSCPNPVIALAGTRTAQLVRSSHSFPAIAG
jgi:hypothetical protein